MTSIDRGSIKREYETDVLSISSIDNFCDIFPKYDSKTEYGTGRLNNPYTHGEIIARLLVSVNDAIIYTPTKDEVNDIEFLTDSLGRGILGAYDSYKEYDQQASHIDDGIELTLPLSVAYSYAVILTEHEELLKEHALNELEHKDAKKGQLHGETKEMVKINGNYEAQSINTIKKNYSNTKREFRSAVSSSSHQIEDSLADLDGTVYEVDLKKGDGINPLIDNPVTI